MQLEIGKEYRVTHQRKGTFTVRVTAISGEWIDCEITKGNAGAMLRYNQRSKGETVTVRESFCKFEPL